MFVKFIVIITVMSQYDQFVSIVMSDHIDDRNNKTAEICWTSNECQINGLFSRENLKLAFPVNIDCSTENTDQLSDRYNRFYNIANISLSGCNVNRQNTLGIEYIPNPSNLRILSIEKFYINSMLYNRSFSEFIELRELILNENFIDRLESKFFLGLNNLEVLAITGNNIQFIEYDIFQQLSSLKELTIAESIAIIDYLTLPENITMLKLIAGKFKWPFIFPEMMKKLCIQETNITFELNQPIEIDRLYDLQLPKNNLTMIPPIISSSLVNLNLSINYIDKLDLNNMTELITLDLSYNQLIEITEHLFKSMIRLQYLWLNNNQIQTINQNAFFKNDQIKMIDISSNQLKSIEFVISPTVIRIVIDQNPWNCNWIQEAFTKTPLFFNILQFENNFESINVKGLKCFGNFGTRQPSDGSLALLTTTNIVLLDESIYRRNAKDTAVLTLAILIGGVTLLFFLLYLHIKCRRRNSAPFYRSISTDNYKLSDRTDIIRKRTLPSTDYEVPIGLQRILPTVESAIDIYEEIPDQLRSTDEQNIQENINAKNK